LDQLQRYLPTPNSLDDDILKLPPAIRLQLAFLVTYPSNISMAIDPELKSPYFVMVMEDEILKIHGSSIVSQYHSMPKWVCCQNMVKSTITGRKMAKLLIPIDDRLISRLAPTIKRKANNFDQNQVCQKVEKKNIPHPILIYLRGKNHDEFINSLLTKHKMFMETDEFFEKISYFFMTPKNKSRKKTEQEGVLTVDEIDKIHEQIYNHSVEIISKKQLLVNLSSLTRLHINNEGCVVDILNSTQFLTIMIKSYEKEYERFMIEQAKLANVPESDFHIRRSKKFERTFIECTNKVSALKLYEEARKTAKESETINFGIIPVRTSGGRSCHQKKWSVEISWYEKPRQDKAIIRVTGEDNLNRLYAKLINCLTPNDRNRKRNHIVVSQESIKNIGQSSSETESQIIVVKNIFANQFEDEIEFTNFVREKLSFIQQGVLTNVTEEIIHSVTFYRQDQDKDRFKKAKRTNRTINRNGYMDVIGGDDEEEEERNADEEIRDGRANNPNRRGRPYDHNYHEELEIDDEDTFIAPIDDELENNPLEDLEEYVLVPKDEFRIEISKYFNEDEYTGDIENIPKEAIFLKETGIGEELYDELDIEARKKLEEAFPKLEQFNMLTFKANRQTKRKAIVYPKFAEYATFFDAMQKLISKKHEKHSKVLDSRVSIKFRGKYIFHFENHIYNNFQFTITEIIKQSGLMARTRCKIQVMDIELISTMDNMKNMKSCSDRLNELLKPRLIKNTKRKISFTHTFRSSQGKKFMGNLIARYKGEALAEYNQLFDHIEIRGTKSSKEIVEREIKEFLQIFERTILIKPLRIKVLSEYLSLKVQCDATAESYDCILQLNIDEPDRLNIITNFYDDNIDTSKKAIYNNMQEERLKNMSLVIEKLKQSISITELDDSMKENTHLPDEILSKMNTKKHLNTDYRAEHSSSEEEDKDDVFSRKYNKEVSMRDKQAKEKLQCSICLNYSKDKYRLFCGHSYCKVCIREYCFSKNEMQQKCMTPGCDAPLQSVDLRNLFNNEELKRLFTNAKQKFLTDKKDQFVECKTSDCQCILENNMYRAKGSKEEREKRRRYVVFCDGCGADFCFNCKKTHYDRDCDNEEVAMSLKESGTPFKFCPQCKAIVTKSEGCDHMTCICGCHFCFVCGKEFKKKDIYEHMRKEHGGIGL